MQIELGNGIEPFTYWIFRRRGQTVGGGLRISRRNRRLFPSSVLSNDWTISHILYVSGSRWKEVLVGFEK
jgi:hypothetical protein